MVGDVFPADPLRFEVTQAVVDSFLEATGNERRGKDAPSMLASVYLVDLLSARQSPPGGIHAKQSIRFFRSLKVGETISIQARVVEKYIRKERPYVVSDFEAKGEDGTSVSSGRITSIWGKDQ
ncbi:MaoC family dehydratase [Tianweitania sediminis]|uniref:MaoC family dehydratase n=1 Tax=Tianweitania sediminis TaxID=1502156 RepID=A0A8J7R0P0_9HYPH|nr:MaoC family dehydratase [Tianweitania sediminis]MBP0440363.1 MaoC family dehydratase [Tianweitania sediminis]